jgi:serralysin
MAKKAKGTNDWLEGGLGDDFLTGGRGYDTFVYRAGGGNDTVTDFTSEDRVLLDSMTGVWDGQLGGYLGRFYDGFEIVNSHGTLVGTIVAGDFNGDGIGDTQIQMSSGSLTLLGVDPSDISSSQLFGG